LKLVKIRFTAWGDKRAAPRATALQRQLDDWAAREDVLQHAAARVQELRSKADSEALRMEFTALTTELANINAQRQPIIDAETVAAQGAQVAMLNHTMVGTFGYQVWNDAGTGVVKIVDDAGNDLPVEAVFSYDIVDDNPTPPAWLKKGRLGE
jgi:hypothetical protein